MANRMINTSFWTDSKIDELFTPEDKYFFLYLMTNPHTSVCGCYEVSVKQMSVETGYNTDTIRHLLSRMSEQHKVAAYDPNTSEVVLWNWPKHNWYASPKIISCLKKDISNIKSQVFKDYLSTLFDNLQNGYPIDTLSIPYTYPIDRVCIPVVSSNVVSSINNTSNSSNNKTIENDSNCIPSSNSNTSSKKRTTEKKLEDFDRFWEAYPKKTEKQLARVEFAKIHGVPVERMIDAINQQKMSDQWLKDGGQYIPSPVRWLKRGQWDDEPVEVRKQSPLSNLERLMLEVSDEQT